MRRNVETRSTFSVLQEEERGPIPNEDPPIVKADKNEKKITAGKGRGKLRKSLNEMKGKGETTPKTEILKNNSNEGTQTEKIKPIKCQKAKCHNDSHIYRTLECLELHERLQHPKGKGKVQEMKEKN